MSRITSETGVWDHLRPKLKYKGHFTRIESGATVLGQPDVNYCIAGIEGNLELKYAKLVKDALTLRPAQYQWMNQRMKNGADAVWILAHVQESNEWILIFGDHARDCIVQPKNWRDFAEKIWVGNININELIEILGN